MTAPVATPAGSSESFTPQSAIEDALSAAFGQTMTESGAQESELLRDEHGRFKPRTDEQDATTDEETKPAEATKPADAKTTPAKDGEAVTLPVADPANLAVAFTLKDEKGELAIPSGLIVEYQANGKTRADPLDKVVKMAQMGVYNAERVQRTLQIEAQNEEIRSYAQSVEQKLQTREQQLTQLLADPEYLARAVQEYQAQQTPEKRAERLQRELDESRLEAERAPIREAGQRYFQQDIVPALETVAKALPHVTMAELGKKLHGFVDPLRDPRTGLVPPTQHARINTFFTTELVPWAQWIDASRAELSGTPSGQQQQATTQAEKDKAKADLEAANLRAQRARRAGTTNLKPAGSRSAPNANGKPNGKAPVTTGDIMEDIIQSVKSTALNGA